MALPDGTRFRVKQLKGGKTQRLAFRKNSNEVVEAVTFNAKGTETARHTPAEFAADRKRKPLRMRP